MVAQNLKFSTSHWMASSLKRTQHGTVSDCIPNEKARREECQLFALPDNLKMELDNQLPVNEKFQAKLFCKEFVRLGVICSKRRKFQS